MDLSVFSPYLLVVLFFIVAFAYSSIGLGGGSSYTALMVIFAFSSAVIPMVSLSLNLFVTSISSYNFLYNKHGRLHIILPFLVSAIPVAYFAGTLHLQQQVFLWVLLISLIFVAVRIYFLESINFKIKLESWQKIVISFVIGLILGFVAGIVGIGGGVYLIPLIIMFGIGSAKEAAATAAVFVWVVSLSGLVSRMQYNTINLVDYIPIIIAVIIGSFVGSYMGSFKLSPKFMSKILGIIVIIAIALLVNKMWFY